MKHFILFYKTVDDFIELRKPHRSVHLAHVQSAHQNGQLIMGGALKHPANEAILIFKVEQASVVEAFAQEDPYVINGLVKQWSVREWNVVIGH